MLDQILAALLPHLLEIAALALTALIGWAAQRFNAWTGIQIEARHRDALHLAIMTGIRRALDAGQSHDVAIDAAVEYAKKSVPDAIRALKPARDILGAIARSKLGEVLGVKTQIVMQPAPNPRQR